MPYPALLEEISRSRSVIIFVNSRGASERLAQRLNELSDEEIAWAHHGSVSHEKRAQIEEGLKSGEIRCIVATSTMELGVDMGAVDRVLLVESPGASARGLQRVGRAGHQVDTASVGRIYPKYRGDLLEAFVVAERMADGIIEPIAMPRNPLDVLAQQISAMCIDRTWPRSELAKTIRRAGPFGDLTDAALDAVLDMLDGRHAARAGVDLAPRVVWDRAKDELSARNGTAMVVRANAGTIPDRGLYAVHLGLMAHVWANSTRRWSLNHALAKSLHSVRRVGGSRKLRVIVSLSPPPLVNQGDSRFGVVMALGAPLTLAKRLGGAFVSYPVQV